MIQGIQFVTLNPCKDGFIFLHHVELGKKYNAYIINIPFDNAKME